MSYDHYRYADLHGDEVRVDFLSSDAVIRTLTAETAPGGYVSLTADAARDLAARLTEWAGEEEPAPPPEFKVGDRVEVSQGRGGEFAGVPSRVVGSYFKYGLLFVRIARESDGEEGGFLPENLQHIAEPPTPDYTALAAEFKPGDLAIVGDNPGTSADGSGYVDPDYAGQAVKVSAEPHTFGPECVRVVAFGRYIGQAVHVAHLTKAKAVPA